MFKVEVTGIRKHNVPVMYNSDGTLPAGSDGVQRYAIDLQMTNQDAGLAGNTGLSFLTDDASAYTVGDIYDLKMSKATK